ncbi:MAG: enoyl-CoA hydratase/isomerase family protein [Mucilaginibacter sp.]|nr:enoyl-CoA hydratase/isomerase family protein [Mucilaginibacter sp.]
MESIKTVTGNTTLEPMRIIKESPAYWRAIFDNPPLNLLGPSMFESLQKLLTQMETNTDLRVVVFESNNPDYYLAHYDVSDPGKLTEMNNAAGPSGMTTLMDTFVRITKAPVVSIARLRGRARGASSEFCLACDMRFASLENTAISQVELGCGVHPGGGGTERLPHLVGRGRALEIILGANDFDGETAEKYGYVNRSLPDKDLDGFVDSLARRIASFDRRPIAAAKGLVNKVSLPSADNLLDSFISFGNALTWPEAQLRFTKLFERGFGVPGDLEMRLAELLTNLLEDKQS